MNEISNMNNSIKAKKISQLTKLPQEYYPTEENPNIDKLKSLYFVLAYNDNEKVANYKMTFDEMIDFLISTGRLSTTTDDHIISYELTNISTSSPREFIGGSIEITLTANTGYQLPDEIEVLGAGGYTYNKEDGSLYIIASKGSQLITINAEGVPFEYTFGITSNGIIYNIQTEGPYYIGSIISVDVSTIDSNHYDIEDRNKIQLSGLDIVTFTKNHNTANISLRVNGESLNTVLYINAEKIYNYYFGYSIENDGIIEYDIYGTPVDAGPNFEISLMKGRNECPIPFEDGFNYGNGVDRIADNSNVYLVVPKKYYIDIYNVFIDDSFNSYKLLAGTSSFEIPVQINPMTDDKMIYGFIHDDVEYTVICISREGKSGRQYFKSIGNIGTKAYKIEWVTLLDEATIKEGRSINASNDHIDVYHINGTVESVFEGYTAYIEEKNGVVLGTYIDGVYTAPDIDETTTVSFICSYEYMGDIFISRKTLTILNTGIDDGLLSIDWRLPVSELDSLSTYVIDPNLVIGQYDDGTESAVAEPSLLRFELVVPVVGTLNGLQYKAPQINELKYATIRVSYKDVPSVTRTIVIKPIGFDNLEWPTDLPLSIYDNELLLLDTTLIKWNNNLDSVVDDIQNVSISASVGTINDNIYTPSTVNNNTTVTFTISYHNFTIQKQMIVKHYDSSIIPTGSYYYIGQYKPNVYTNPNNDLVESNSDKTGWRTIPNNGISYISNPLYECPNVSEDKIKFYEDATYYVVIPSDFIIKDLNGDKLEIETEQITIGGVVYDIYEFLPDKEYYDDTFNYNIYYTDETPYFVYWGPILPTINTNPYDDLAKTSIEDDFYYPGWIPIGNNLEIDKEIPGNDFSWYNPDEDSRYIVLPKNTAIKDAMDATLQLSRVNEVTILGKDYVIYLWFDYKLNDGPKGTLYFVQ